MWHPVSTCAAVATAFMCAVRIEAAADELLPPMNGQPSDFAIRRAGAEVGARYRIETGQEGLYRVTWTQLTQAGISPSLLVGDQLRLYNRTQEVALAVSSSGLFTGADSFMFYGQYWDGAYSKTNVYWLGFGGSGKRMPTRPGTLLGNGVPVTSHWQTVVCGSKTLYQAYYRCTDETMDHWFITSITGVWANVEIPTEGCETGGQARLDIVLDGLWDEASVNPDHKTALKVEGNAITNFYHEAKSAYTGTVWFSASQLDVSSSKIALKGTQAGVTYDWSLLRDLRIGYWRKLRLPGAALTFDGESGPRNYTVSNVVSSSGAQVLDITDPVCPVLVTGLVVEAYGGHFRLRFGTDCTAAPRFHVAESAQVRSVAAIKETVFRDLGRTSRSAEWIAVCPYAFRDSVYTLLKHRHKEGLKVAVAPIEDIYNEFGYGIVDAAALKQFLGYAYHHWGAPRIRYVCLVGKGTYDPLDRLGLHVPDRIPVRMGASGFNWASHDNWYGFLTTKSITNGMTDVSIGRIPATTPSQLRSVVNKILAFEADTGTWRTKAMLVADRTDGADNFNQVMTNSVRPHLDAAGFSSTLNCLNPPSLTADAIRSNIATKINGGCFFVSFLGHGAHDQWSRDNVWNNAAVTGLTNAKYPLVTMFTCESGAIHDPTAESLAEVFVNSANKGAVAVVAASDLTVLHWSAYVADGFTKALSETRVKRIGDALQAGLAALAGVSPASYELTTFEVIGDPGLVVNP